MTDPQRIPPLPPLPSQPTGLAWPSAKAPKPGSHASGSQEGGWPTGLPKAGTAIEALDSLIDRAFTQPNDLGETHAFLAIQGGQIIRECYADGHGPDDTQHSWSMAKSITHALVGLLVKDGLVDPAQPINAPEWQAADDPRAVITLDQLLRMSSGLRFTEDYVDAGVSHTIDMLFGAGKADTAGFAAAMPLDHPPGQHWSYSSGTTNIIARFAAQAMGVDRAGFEAFMRTRLFEPIGMASPVPKFDSAGTFIGSSFCFCTPRDFARFGLLYLRDGLWDGQLILPTGWVDTARTPTLNVPEAEPMGYGAHWWLGLAGPGSFSANGYNGQYIVLVPNKDLILVRHGVSEPQKDNVRHWLADVAACF